MQLRKTGSRCLAFVLALLLTLSLFPATALADNTPAHVIINQVFGGSTDGSASHSFIELYNPTDAAVDLSGWSVQYRSSESGSHSDQWYKLDLTGTIGPNDYYLIRCGATESGSYAVPAGNQEWDIPLHSKGLSVALVNSQTQLADDVKGDVSGNESIIDLAACAGNDYKASKPTEETDQLPPAWEGEGLADADGLQSKKKAIRRSDFGDTDNSAADFTAVDYSKAVSADNGPHVGAYTPDTPDVPDTPDEPAVQAPFTVGYENETAALALTQIGRYGSGMTNADGGVMEIVDYNNTNGYAYAVNGQSGKLAAISLAALGEAESDGVLSGMEIDVAALVNDEGFTYGDMTSVAVSPDGTKLAAAIQAADYTANGRVALFTCNGDGTLTFEKAIETGVQPDMVTFTPDGSKILTANEGEPRMGYTAEGAVDPAGSVTIIRTADYTAQTVGFTAYDSAEAHQALADAGIVLKKETAPSVDLEPEYIACTNTTVYISLQEANAIAVLDIAEGTFTGIYSVGFQDYSQVAIDLGNGDGQYAPQTYDNLKGIRMPDGIALYTVGGVDYLLTANEGDSRAWPVDTETDVNENKSKTSPNGRTFEKKVTWFDADQYDGLETGVDYLFGGRSFTLLKVTDTGLEEVFDSGSDFESRTAGYLPAYFNCSNDALDLEDRSGKKGPEPETVTVGEVDGRTYAFVTLERIGGVMVYDITDPAGVSYVNYINSRDFSATLGADDSPEGLKFIPAANSPTGEALLLAACEVGGTVAVYVLTSAAAPDDPDPAVPDPPAPDPVLPAPPAPDPVLPESPVDPAVPDDWSSPYPDVAEEDWYYDAVRYVTEKGLMNGMDDGSFAPTATLNRAMLVTILFRLEGEPSAAGAAAFDDVTGDAWYADAVAWASASGLVNGYGDGSFGPLEPITREQMAAILFRYAQHKGYELRSSGSLAGFTDGAATSSWAEAAVEWAVGTELLAGKGEGLLDPRGSAVRAEVAQIIMNFCETLAP
ncbi:MAG: choice-of-anchor I family protein [Oscillospiraceae bacterium]